MSAQDKRVINDSPEYLKLPVDEEQPQVGKSDAETRCCTKTTVFSVLEFVVPTITVGQLLVLKYRNVIMPDCPSQLMVSVTPVLACETLLITLMILCVTVLSFHQEQICGKLVSYKEYINVLPAFFFLAYVGMFLFFQQAES